MDSLEVLNPRAKDVVVHLGIAKHKSTTVGIQHNDIDALQGHLPGRVATSSLGRDLFGLECTHPVCTPGVTLDHHGALTRNKKGAQV